MLISLVVRVPEQKDVAVMRASAHRNIVQMHTAFVHDQSLWLVMDYMDRGAMLSDTLRAPACAFFGAQITIPRLFAGSCGDQLRSKHHQGFPETAVHHILRQVVGALDYLHKEDMIHR